VKLLHACISLLPSRSLDWASDQAELAGLSLAHMGWAKKNNNKKIEK